MKFIQSMQILYIYIIYLYICVSEWETQAIMNTATTTTSASKAKGSEFLVMVVICLLAIYGAFSLIQPGGEDSEWSQTQETEESVVYRSSMTGTTGLKILEN